MSFKLEVEFSGLCLYVLHPDGDRVAVLMPDARKTVGVDLVHVDGSEGIPHVGYVRFDLANTSLALPAGTTDFPAYEAIHRFDGEQIHFDIDGEPGPMTADPGVPAFEDIAPDQDPMYAGRSFFLPDTSLINSATPAGLLMRTVLSGGDLSGERNETFFFSNLFNPGQQALESQFASYVTWTRTFDTSVTLRITDFNGDERLSIPLAPPAGSPADTVVRLKVANFCDINPLEWEELGLRAADHDDEDFKWIYRLLSPRQGTLEGALLGHRLPIPLLPRIKEEGVEDCLGAQVTASFT